MRDRTRPLARSRYGALGLALSGTGLLLVASAATSSAASPSGNDPVLTAQSRGESQVAALAAPLAAGSPRTLVTPAAGPVLDAAGLSQIAAYVRSLIPVPAPPPAPPVAPPATQAPVAATPSAPKMTKTTTKSTTSSTRAATPKAPTAPKAAAPVSAGSAYESRLLTLVNQARAQNGLAPLALNSCAQSKAQSWAAAQASADVMSHQDLGAVLSACHATRAGENVAYGNISADQMFANWMNSPGHRANILNPAYTAMGNGAAGTASGRIYGSQVFLTV